MRCAIKKYFESGVVPTELEAIIKLRENYIDKNIGDSFDHNEWRMENTFNVFIDNTMKAHTKLFEHCYD